MKLTEKERRTVEALRELDTQQRDGIVAYVHRQRLANNVIAKIARVPRLRTIENRKIEKAYGAPRPRIKRP